MDDGNCMYTEINLIKNAVNASEGCGPLALACISLAFLRAQTYLS